jgi:esterase/lipase
MLAYLQPLDIKFISLSCKHLNKIANEEILWKKLCHRDFNEFGEEMRAIFRSSETQWRSTYTFLTKVRALVDVIKSPVETLKVNNDNQTQLSVSQVLKLKKRGSKLNNWNPH